MGKIAGFKGLDTVEMRNYMILEWGVSTRLFLY